MAKDDKVTKKAAAKKLAEKMAAAKKVAEKKAAAKQAADKKAAKKVAEKAAEKKAAAKKAAKKLADKLAAAKKLPAKTAKSPKPERAEVRAMADPVAGVAPAVEAAGPTRRELLVQAGQLGIVGRHRMSKVDLEAAVAAH